MQLTKGGWARMGSIIVGNEGIVNQAKVVRPTRLITNVDGRTTRGSVGRSAATVVAAVFCAVLASGVGAADLCTKECLVQVGPLLAEYPRKATIEAEVRNTSSRTLTVVVVVEELSEDRWWETPLTVSDPDHGFKVVRLSPIRAGETVGFPFTACSSLKLIPMGGGGRDVLIPCPDSVASPTRPQRLRVSVQESGRIIQEVASQPYRVLPD